MPKDDIVIRRKKSKKEEDEDESELFEDIDDDNDDDENDEEEEKNYDKQLKSLAVVLFLFAILLAIALVSYTSEDDANAQLTLSQLFDLISGDEQLKYRAENTNNFLGIIGAFISKLLYHSTVGYIIIFLPYFISLISKDLFKELEITNSTLKKLIVFILFTILFSGFTGTLTYFEYFSTMSIEWSGTVGLFIAQITTNLVGSVGSLLIYLASMIALILLGTEIKIDKLLHKGLDGVEASSTGFKSMISKLKDNLSEKAEAIKEEKRVEKLEKKADKKKKKNEKKATLLKTKKKNNQKVEEKTDEDENEDTKYVENSNDDYNKNDEDILKITRDNQIEVEPILEKPTLKITKITQTDEEELDEINENDELNEIEEIHDSSQSKILNIDIDKNENVEPNNSIADEINDLMKDINEENDNDDIITKEVNLQNNDNVNDNNENNKNDVNDEKELENSQENNEAKLILDVEDIIEEEELNSPLSTQIHDENIKYIPPKFSLLEPDKGLNRVADDELKENARILQDKLETFKIFIENLQITPGPVVTQYAFTPAAGIKISRIESLSDDLAMALKARGIRIIAPIPGKGSVGIEIPNANPSLVSFSSVVKSKRFQEADMYLPFALGKTISGEVALADLAKMPHLLIAGSTGSGKSVGVNSIISSLLYKKMPSDLKFVIIDPKKVELQQYSKLKNHFIAMSPDVRSPIITDPQESVSVLKSAVIEMENRYDILAKVGQRNIADYNKKVKEGKYKNDKEMVHRPMPYIVVIVDEFADLILTAGKEVEEPIVRLAQMARAVGIHMILATQRPSVDVITGIIKANFPARMAFLVASKIDSRTILDMGGAEKLLGNGDMLFLPSGRPKPERIQNSFISTDEVDDICNHIGNQKGYSEPYFLPSIHEKKNSDDLIQAEDRDILFEDAARLVVSTQQGSVSMLQRRLKIGYARAGRIVDELEDAGVVGPFDGSKARQVILESVADLERII